VRRAGHVRQGQCKVSDPRCRRHAEIIGRGSDKEGECGSD
jgi:hypothetical protein